MLHIKSAKPEDIADIVAIRKAVGEDDWSLFSINQLLANDYKAIVAKDGRTTQGFIIFNQVLESAEIISIAVDPNFQKQGIATLLMQHLIDNDVKKETKEIFLEVACDNRPAINLYTKIGFKKVGTRPKYYLRNESRIDAYIMKINFS